MIPAYLQEPNTEGHLYGTLTYDESTRSWGIEGEPVVVELAKRLFPGSTSLGPGRARFPANKRSAGDLNWLMLRFPLRVEDQARWHRAREEAIRHALIRQEIAQRTQRVTPPPTFVGELRPYQEEALAFLLNHDRALLADEMGLGKNPVALAWLAALNKWPALVVVPPHLVRLWAGDRHHPGEIGRFLRLDPPGQARFRFGDEVDAPFVHVIRGLKPYELPPASIYVIRYHLLRGWKEILPDAGFRAVVFDEIQELRHAQTEKYSAASLLASHVEHVIGLSGTPIHNRGGEIWSVLNILEYHCPGDYDSFTREWCYGYGNDVVKYPELLGNYLRREGLLLRRAKDEVLDQLPPKRRVVQTIDHDVRLYNSLVEVAVEAAARLAETRDVFARGRLVREAIEATRRATGLAKAKYVAQFVKALLEAGEPTLLFAYHHDVWDAYAEELRELRPVRITGREAPAQKDEAVRAFMVGQTDLCMISLRAAAGLNLQRARVVVFGELDWSPAVHSQAEDRAHRIGQRDSVLCYYLVTDEGTDPDMLEALGLKVQQFTALMGDRPETEQDRLLAQSAAREHMARVIERLQARAAGSGRRPVAVGG